MMAIMIKLCILSFLSLPLYSQIIPEDKLYKSMKDYINALPDKNNEPVFGVLSLPRHEYDPSVKSGQVIEATYVKFLEMSGAQVVPISLNNTYEEIDTLLSLVNGVLFTGGTADFWVNNNSKVPVLSEYASKGCYIYEKVKKFNDRYHFFPLWGTCLGFELIHVCANNQYETIGNFYGNPAYTQTHQFSGHAYNSVLFSYNGYEHGEKIISILEHKNASLLGHNFGISPKLYLRQNNLTENFMILSIMKDRAGEEFVGIIEAKKYPIFGVQFHPEINIFKFTKDVYTYSN
jgi:gamma-glutamyl hydrolase